MRQPTSGGAGALLGLGLGLLGACGSDGSKDSTSLDQSCSPYPVPEDALTEDVLVAGGSGYACHRPAPDATCVEAEGGDLALIAFEQGKPGVDCEEGTLVIDGSCPEDLVVGRCHFDERREVWSVYPCNRWDDLPDGEAAGCEGAGGRWEPADD